MLVTVTVGRGADHLSPRLAALAAFLRRFLLEPENTPEPVS